MKYEPFYSLIIKLRENEITRERFIYEWAQCQCAQRRASNARQI